MGFLPHNGSALANALLVTTGAIIGAGLTWSFSHHFSSANSPETAILPQNDDTSLTTEQHRSLPSSTASIDSMNASIKSAGNQEDPRERAEQLRKAGSEAAERNLTEALHAGTEIESKQDQLEYHLGIYREWAERDPEAALNYAKTHFAPGLLQSETISVAINKWGAENPREAWIWADQQLSGPLKEQALTDLMIGWTRRSPTAAANWLRETGNTNQLLFSAVARTIAESSPADGHSWAESLPPGALQETVKVAIAGEWARDNPAEAAKNYAKDVESEHGVNLATTISQIWGTTDPVATSKWINELAPGPGKNEAAATLATVWATTDIQSAIAWSSQLSDPEARQQVISHLGTTWGAIEPLAALAWLDSLPAADASEGKLGAYNSWAATAPADMENYIQNQPDTPALDSAKLSLGEVLTDQNLPAALDLALNMHDATASEFAVARFYRRWLKQDHSSADSWLGNRWDTLPPNIQDRLNKEVQALNR